MGDQRFWQSIRKIAQEDNSIEVPRESVDAALSIFQPVVGVTRTFQLKPSFAGMVRNAAAASRLVYEMDSRFVQLERLSDRGGIHLSGFASGVDETNATLFGDEVVFEAPINHGEFEFKSIPPGCYSLAFDSEGESLWIPKLTLEEVE